MIERHDLSAQGSGITVGGATCSQGDCDTKVNNACLTAFPFTTTDTREISSTMESPGQISPTSTQSSSPANEEVNFQAPSGGSFDKGFISTLASQLTPFASGGGSSKRRLGSGSSYQPGSSARDPKSRRRENSGRMDTGTWDAKGRSVGKQKEEFLDQHLVDYLRKGTALASLLVPPP